jgi:hypothetical protein
MSPPADRRARGYQGAISAHTDAQAVAACTLAADQDHFRQDARDRRAWRSGLLRGPRLQPFACDQRGSLAGRPPALRHRFTSTACGKRGADVRARFQLEQGAAGRAWVTDDLPAVWAN